MAKYLVDTSILIDHLKDQPRATQFLTQTKSLSISFVTLGELLQGVRDKQDLKLVKNLTSCFEIVWGSVEINKKAVAILEKYYLSQGIGFLDALQAAICLINSQILATDNLKHFKFIPNLKIISPKNF